MRLFALYCVCILATCSGIGQSVPSATPLSFDVAAVRPSKPDASPRSNVPLDAGNVYGTVDADDARSAASGLFIATHQALWRYITFAYKLSGTQELALRFNMFSGAPKSGAPTWVAGTFTTSPEFFDITARAPADTSIDQMRRMMQALLADRFHLVAHYMSADAPVFALVVANPGATGPNLKLHPQSDSCASSIPEKPSNPAPDPASAHSSVGDLPPICGVIAHVASSSPGLHYGARAVSLLLLATSVPTMTGLAAMPRPVVDDTGLSGLYDFTLTWVHDPTGADASIDDNAANFRDSLKSQLGLKLKPSHAPLSFFVIDHVERPSEN